MTMGTLDGKTLRDALSKAKNVGIVEEAFTLEGCELVLRNLRPDEYTAVLQDCQGLDDVEYIHAYQKGHIARSLVGINGVDFHDVEFVEDEEPDPKRPERTRTIKIELHSYLLKNVVGSWSREAVYTAYRKFGDVVALAERKAKEGITFLLPEETDEEKYRRLLLEARDSEAALPGTLVDRILDEQGLMKKSTAEEIKAAMEKADQLAREQAPEPEPPEPPPAPATVAAPQAQPEAPRLAQHIPSDPHQTLQQAIAARRAPQGTPVPQPATPVVQSEQSVGTPVASATGRSAKIAALEAEVELPETLPGGTGQIPVHQQMPEAVEITHKQERFDPKEASTILNRPPTGGLNPRFRPPPRA